MLVKTSVQAKWSLHNGRPLANRKDTILSILKIMFMYQKKEIWGSHIGEQQNLVGGYQQF